jgi:glutathione S-transferase
MVSLVYERILHESASDAWVARCETQIGDVLDALEADRSRQPSSFWFGDKPGHADVAVGCALRFLAEAHSDILAIGRWPGLAGHAERCEALAVFQSVVQRFDPPKR